MLSTVFKLELNPGQRLFFTSDTHLWHKNIINYCNRPFDSVEQMNTELIKRWNNVVGPNDIVFHLGDFAFGVYEEIRETGSLR